MLSDEDRGLIILADNLAVLRSMPSESVDLIYIDPPFNTGKKQKRNFTKTTQDENGDRTGFQGKQYATEVVGSNSYADSFDDYLGFLRPRMKEAHRLLKPTGSLYFHIDYREVHYCKVLLDQIFGRKNFINEIIWAYDYGARAKKRWPAKHDNILFYAKDQEKFFFDLNEVDRIPYMAPALVGAEKAERGKSPTDCWWHTIVSPTSKEKLGYPTQKPIGILNRIVKTSCPHDGIVLDFFAGSGTTGASALASGRKFILVDELPEAIDIMKKRFEGTEGVRFDTDGKSFKPELKVSDVDPDIIERMSLYLIRNYRGCGTIYSPPDLHAKFKHTEIPTVETLLTTLSSGEKSAITKHWSFVDHEGEEFDLTEEDVKEVQKTGEFFHPTSGAQIHSWRDRIGYCYMSTEHFESVLGVR